MKRCERVAGVLVGRSQVLDVFVHQLLEMAGALVRCHRTARATWCAFR